MFVAAGHSGPFRARFFLAVIFWEKDLINGNHN